MATITLYKCADENNKVLKTPDTTTAVNVVGVFRKDISVLNPIFTIESSTDLTHYNYCKIEEFNRYYFITDISIIRNGLYQFKCKVDVLYTYASEIYNLKAVVKRQQEQFNTYINDNQYMALNYPRVQTYAFPNGFSSNLKYILTTAGKGA